MPSLIEYIQQRYLMYRTWKSLSYLESGVGEIGNWRINEIMMVIYLGVVTNSTPSFDDVRRLLTITHTLIGALFFFLRVPATWNYP